MGVGPWKTVQCVFCKDKMPNWMLESHIKAMHAN